MRFEVENKFPVARVDALVERLEANGVVIGSPISQIDLYFAHPVRDFASTDEAFRLRRIGEENRLTYKGPKLDAATRTRREIELAVAGGAAGARDCVVLVDALGFRSVMEVRKERRPFELASDGHVVTGALDAVDALGTFAELELVVEADDVAGAQRILLDTADALALGPPEPRSYLELLMERGRT